MKTPLFTGSGVALVTPFTYDGVDTAALERLIDFHLESGTDALIVCGTTGEAATMSYAERAEVIATAAERVNGRIPVVAGTGSNSTENAVKLSRDALSAGADGLLVVTPYYNKATQPGLVRHYRTVADAVDRPLILYNVPSRTGVTCTAETYAALAAHPNIQGVKEAGGDLSLVQRTREICPGDFYIWSGNDDETAPIMLLGGVGVVSVAANLIPREVHQLTAACLAGDLVSAGRRQLRLRRLCEVLFREVNPIPVKTALRLMGRCGGILRSPLCEPEPEHLAELKAVLAEYGLI